MYFIREKVRLAVAIFIRILLFCNNVVPRAHSYAQPCVWVGEGGGWRDGKRVAVGNDLLSTVKMGLGGIWKAWEGEGDFVNCTAGPIFRRLHFNTNLYIKISSLFLFNMFRIMALHFVWRVITELGLSDL